MVAKKVISFKISAHQFMVNCCWNRTRIEYIFLCYLIVWVMNIKSNRFLNVGLVSPLNVITDIRVFEDYFNSIIICEIFFVRNGNHSMLGQKAPAIQSSNWYSSASRERRPFFWNEHRYYESVRKQFISYRLLNYEIVIYILM